MTSTLRIENLENQLIVVPPNEIYIERAIEIRESVFLLIGKERKEVVFDFSCVNYIDGSGIGVLIAIHNRSKVKLKGVTGNIKGFFELTKLTQVFEFID